MIQSFTGTICRADGTAIDLPLEGDEGLWTPSDQDVRPITPIRIRVFKGEWWSEMAIFEYHKSGGK